MHNALVPASPNTFPLETTRRIIRIQALTLIWMTLEAVVSLGAAWMARSPALLGFGGDSAVELLSAAVVLHCHRFYFGTARTRRGPAKPCRDSPSDPCGSGHALARKTKTATLSRHRERGVKGRCCRVWHLWLSSLDCFGGSARQCDLEGELGRPGCCVVIVSPDCA